MLRHFIKTMSQIEYETIKSLELAYQTKFTDREIYSILERMRKNKN